MASLIDQVRAAMERGVAAEQSLHCVGQTVAQIAQVAYSLNCIWLYSTTGGPPSADTLQKTLPPAHDGTVETTLKALEYTRKTMLVVRSLVSEKIESTVKAKQDLSAIEGLIAGFGSTEIAEPSSVIKQLDSDEVDDVIEAVVPRSLRPTTPATHAGSQGEPCSDSADRPANAAAIVKKSKVKGKKPARPWLFT